VGEVKRRCVSCRKESQKKLLLRLVGDGGELRFDMLQKRPGRGAYLCPGCLFAKGSLPKISNSLEFGSRSSKKRASKKSSLSRKESVGGIEGATEESVTERREFRNVETVEGILESTLKVTTGENEREKLLELLKRIADSTLDKGEQMKRTPKIGFRK